MLKTIFQKVKRDFFRKKNYRIMRILFYLCFFAKTENEGGAEHRSPGISLRSIREEKICLAEEFGEG